MYAAGYLSFDSGQLSQYSENKRSNKYWTLIYIKQGTGMYLLENDLVCLNEGDILFFPPGVGYSFSAADLGDEYNINIDSTVLRFDESWLNALIGVFHGLGKVALNIKEIRSACCVTGLKWLAVSSLMSEIRSGSAIRQAQIAIEILEHISAEKDMIPISSEVRSEGGLGDRLEKIERYIDCNIYRKISLDEISVYSGMNRTYFSLFFKKHFGQGLTEYINTRKIDIASGMLVGTDKPIGDIALECGFSNVNYFNRIFRNVKGKSPSRYRSGHRSKLP